jgi:hypothetical protein
MSRKDNIPGICDVWHNRYLDLKIRVLIAARTGVAYYEPCKDLMSKNAYVHKDTPKGETKIK